eukprot:CCRYP_006880-RA/>CCRYP_006880-RA protein AED:0.42 eAED:0.42 QI:0/-1/0/1/-1/1/1/0/420
MADNNEIAAPSKPTARNPYVKVSPSTPVQQTIDRSIRVSSPVATDMTETNPTTPPRTNHYVPRIAPATPDVAPNPCAITPSPSKLTPVQRATMEENRKRALERRVASLENQEPNKKARREAINSCRRCGSINPDSLCIIWAHSGERQPETRSGSDCFRFSCCGRIAPSCCFVGRHAFSPSDVRALGSSRNVVIECHCHNGPARLLCTRKDNSNCGRYFFRCSSHGGGKCDFFLWADKAFDLKQTRDIPAHHEIKEWIHVYANPFDQEVNWMERTASMMPQSLPILRERLIAALLMHQCCGRVVGEAGVSCTPRLESVTEIIQQIFMANCFENRKALLLKELYPLNQDQISRRFGVSFKENDPLLEQVPSVQECISALSKATRENSVLRSCRVKLESVRQPAPGVSVTLIHLEGLVNYFAS